MRLRTQFLLGSAILAVLLLSIAGFYAYTEIRVQGLTDQREIAASIERRANDLSYLSHKSLLYQEQLQYARWESTFAAFQAEIDRLNLDSEEHAALVASIRASSDRLGAVFGDVVLSAGAISSAQTPNYDPTFLQASWGRLDVQTRQIVSDATRLHQALGDEAGQASRTTTILALCVMGVFGLFLLANYFFIYRRTSAGLAALERGTEIIGSGDLDFRIPETRRDEIGNLSRAFNKMAADLKGVTASKKDLEKEIARRELAEGERERLFAEEQRLGEELAAVNEELRAQNEELALQRQHLASRNVELEEAREETARLLEKQRELFLRLQEALLEIPTEVPGVRFSHLYRSATEEAQIGGDFYDVFQTRDGRIGLLIGDVSGRGIDAARIATLTKDTIRAFAHKFGRPHLVLRETNRLLIQRRLSGFVTVFLGFLNPDTGVLLYSSAGHPPPIVAGESLTVLESGSFPLGVVSGGGYRDVESHLASGATILLYTDGITEARSGDGFFGEQGLVDAVSRGVAGPVEELPSFLLDRALAFTGGTLGDDVAIVAVSYAGPIEKIKEAP